MLIKPLLLSSASLLMLIWPFSCETNPNSTFQGGIRNVAYVGLATNPADLTGIGNVLATGQVGTIYDPAESEGVDSAYGGLTSAATGFFDDPNAITAALWNMQMSWTDAEPECEAAVPSITSKNSITVPPGGQVVIWACLL